MKTFKLKALSIIENEQAQISEQNIPLIDGLAINREDEQNRWVIEAYMDLTYMDLIKRLQEKNEDIMIEVKITKESNPPALFITSIIGINEIGANMNVLFLGKIIDKRNHKIEELLTSLINKGYEGEVLLEKFKGML